MFIIYSYFAYYAYIGFNIKCFTRLERASRAECVYSAGRRPNEVQFLETNLTIAATRSPNMKPRVVSEHRE